MFWKSCSKEIGVSQIYLTKDVFHSNGMDLIGSSHRSNVHWNTLPGHWTAFMVMLSSCWEGYFESKFKKLLVQKKKNHFYQVIVSRAIISFFIKNELWRKRHSFLYERGLRKTGTELSSCGRDYKTHET